MITKATYEQLLAQYHWFNSWAVWGAKGETPASNISLNRPGFQGGQLV